MVESKEVSETSPKLSATDRLILVQTLNALPSAQFEELLIALNPPNGNIPDNTAPQANRSAALFQWVESPIGPGLRELEIILGMIVAAKSQTSPDFLSFAISGTISSKTVAEVKAIVELLRKKIGDNSIDVVFFKEGSINIILSGAPEGLQKLKELFEAGELKDLEIPTVESVHYVDNKTDTRKARLIEILKIESKSSPPVAHDLASDLYQAIKRASDLGRASASDRASDLASDLASALDHALNRTSNYIRTLYNSLSLDLIPHRGLNPALIDASNRARARSLTFGLDLNLYISHDLDRARALVSLIDYKHQLNLREIDLSNTNFGNIDLRQADLTNVDFTRANLAGAILTGANLTGTNFTETNVTETVFGENLGLTESNKLNLQKCGAIFVDPPNSDNMSFLMQ